MKVAGAPARGSTPRALVGAHASHNRLPIAIIAGLQSVMHLSMEAANGASLGTDGADSHRRVVEAA